MAMDLLWVHCRHTILVCPILINCNIDLNLPLTGIAFLLVLFFLRVRTPPGSIKSKLKRLDILCVSEQSTDELLVSDSPGHSGNTIIITGTTIALIGLTWGGVAYKWTNPHTLATLIVGFVLMGAFFVYEWLVPKEPSIPWEVVSNRTPLSACVAADVIPSFPPTGLMSRTDTLALPSTDS